MEIKKTFNNNPQYQNFDDRKFNNSKPNFNFNNKMNNPNHLSNNVNHYNEPNKKQFKNQKN